MATTIDARDAAAQLGELLTRTQNEGERFLIERDGAPVAALVPHTALAPDPSKVEAPPEAPQRGESEREKEEALLRSMEERGLITRPKPDKFVPFSERPLIHVEGKPVSETIIEDRR